MVKEKLNKMTQEATDGPNRVEITGFRQEFPENPRPQDIQMLVLPKNGGRRGNEELHKELKNFAEGRI